ncbi:DUF624 domain-containing protein [Marinilactibacillus sp. Marseille-P9653]|uniref:DUF624 domain-containing protein n=1 Tax=Marinilactibacillus sp. Marseille-P9653 TaxID=2866583 RepID=UPI001CE3C4D4|nr:DUF624 domain-containing protein [Marinilactibacillus sp. Marseille-P9653]
MAKGKFYFTLYELSDKLTTLFLFNLFWLMLNIPVILLTMQILVVTQLGSYYILGPLLIWTLPVFFYPSTQALFCVVRDLILDKGSLTLKSFWTYFITNYKESFLTGIMLTGALVGVGVGLFYSWSISFMMFTIFLVLLFYVLTMIIQLFSFQAHFNMPVWWKFKRMHQLVFAKILYSISSLLVVLLILYATFEMSLFIFVLAAPVASVYSAFFLFKVQYNKMMRLRKQTSKRLDTSEFLEV